MVTKMPSFTTVVLMSTCVMLSIDASLLLNVTSAGTLPTPISGGTTFFSPDGRLFIAAFTNNVTAFDTASGAVVWVAAVEGLVCPGATSSLSMDSQSSNSWDDSVQPLYTQPETTGAPSSVAVYCGCGPTITAITYSGEVSTIYTCTQPSDVVVAITTLTPRQGRPIVAAVLSGSHVVVAVDGSLTGSGGALWNQSVAGWGMAFPTQLRLHSGVDTERNASIVCLIVIGMVRINVSGYDALTGTVKGNFTLNFLEIGANPVFGVSVIMWGGAWNAPSSVIVYDFVTQQQWTYYPVFPVDLWSAMPGVNGFIVGSFDQLVLLNATSRQVEWTYVDVNLFTAITYDATHATLTLWNPRSDMVSLVNATDGTLLLRTDYVGSVCGPPAGGLAAGMWLRGAHTGDVIGLTCNATVGLALIALRGTDVAPVVTVDPFPQLTPLLTSSAPSLTSLPALTLCSAAGPDCRVETSVVFVTFSGVVTMVYRVTIDKSFASTTTMAPVTNTTAPSTTDAHPLTPTFVTTVAPASSTVGPSSTTTGAPRGTDVVLPPPPPSSTLLHYVIGGCVGAAVIALIAGGCLIMLRRRLLQRRILAMSDHQHRIAAMEVDATTLLHDDLLVVHAVADTLQ